MPEDTPSPATPRPRQIVHCAKCNEQNLAGATRCHECGAHLYLGCPKCGEGNLRTLRHCTQCGTRLGRSRLNRLKDKVFRRFTPLETILGLTVFIIALVIIIRLSSRVGAPEVEEPGLPVYDHTVPGQPPKPVLPSKPQESKRS